MKYLVGILFIFGSDMCCHTEMMMRNNKNAKMRTTDCGRQHILCYTYVVVDFASS